MRSTEEQSFYCQSSILGVLEVPLACSLNTRILIVSWLHKLVQNSQRFDSLRASQVSYMLWAPREGLRGLHSGIQSYSN